MLEKLKELKYQLEDKLVSFSLTLQANVVIKKIMNDNYDLEEVVKFMSKNDKSFRSDLLDAYKDNDMVYEVLNRADDLMEKRRFEDYINSVKSNTYKEFLNTLLPIQIYDLKGYTIKKSNVMALYDKEKQKEYETCIEILCELETSILGIELVDFVLLEKQFKTMTIEEIASYIKTYPDIFIYMEPKDKEVEYKMTKAALLTGTNDVEKLTDNTLIYKKRKYYYEKRTLND